MEREDWLKERRKGIGSSDAAAVCGLSPYAQPLGVFLEKTGRLPSRPDNPAIRWGVRLESVVADAYAETTGRELTNAPPILWHKDHGFMCASIDRQCKDDGRIVEIKTAGIRQAKEWGEPGSDEVPEQYLVQVTHQMIVAGRDIADIAVLIGGQDFRIYTIPLNARLAAGVIERERDFWGHVERDEAPAIDWGHDGTLSLIEALHHHPDGEIVLGDDVLPLVKRYAELGDIVGQTKGERDEIKARLIHMMGDAGQALLPDGQRIRRNKIQRDGYTVEPSEYFDFRVLKPRKTRA